MRLALAALIALPLLLSAAPALADVPADQSQASNATAPTPPAPPPVKAKPKLDPNQVICKREGNTGSRIGSEEQCMTRSQWDDLSSESQQRFNDERQNGNINAPPKSGL